MNAASASSAKAGLKWHAIQIALMQGEGQQGIAAMIEAARQKFPGYRFVLTGTPDGHGNFTRFSWRLISPDGENVAGGTDVVSLNAEGQIENVVGFLDGAAS